MTIALFIAKFLVLSHHNLRHVNFAKQFLPFLLSSTLIGQCHLCNTPCLCALTIPHSTDMDFNLFLNWISIFCHGFKHGLKFMLNSTCYAAPFCVDMDFAAFGPSGDILNKDVPAWLWKVSLLTRTNKQSWPPANPKPLVPSVALRHKSHEI